MIFEINFNRGKDTDLNVLRQISREEEGLFFIEIHSLQELLDVEKRVRQLTGQYFSLIVGDDPPTIYLDKDI